MNDDLKHRIKQIDLFFQKVPYIKSLIDKDKQYKTLTELYQHTCKYNVEDVKECKDVNCIMERKKYSLLTITQDLNAKMHLISSGSTGHTFRLRIQDKKDICYAMKIVPYNKSKINCDEYGRPSHIRRPENAELLIIKLLGKLVLMNQTPHLVLPLCTFVVDKNPFIKLKKESQLIDENKKEHKKFCKFVDSHEKYSANISILVSEWANYGDFLHFIRNAKEPLTLKQWKVFTFQILSTLAVIHYHFPSFRHNDLKPNNILMHKLNDDQKIYSYKVNGKEYEVPGIGYQLRIWDFDFASIDGIYNNKVIADWTTKINVTPEKNQYYDVHFFFNTLIHFVTTRYFPKEFKKFIKRVLPECAREKKNCTKKYRFLLNKEITTPLKLLEKDNFFKEFRKI